MNMKLEPGKRYRLTFDGKASPDGCLTLPSGLVLGDLAVMRAVDAVLLPDPLPTAPGSVISVNGFAYARTGEDVNDKHWAGLQGRDRGGAYSDAEFANDEVTVLFDAGAKR